MDIPVLYEDTDLLIINKPPGIIVNRAATVRDRTVQDWAEERLFGPSGKPDSTSDFTCRAGIVHRLDKETSGVLVIAKNEPVFLAMQNLFKEREIRKTYLALVHGRMEAKEGEINAPVGRLPWNRERFGIVPEGKPAVTRYAVLRELSVRGEPASLLEAYPKTGRTHQLRVHFKYSGHPIVGDYAYAGRKTSRRDREVVDRVMLHAWKMSFMHPVTRMEVNITAPIPDDIQTVIGQPLK